MQQTNASDDYLDLLKKSLLNEIYLDDELRLLYLRKCLSGEDRFDYAVYHDIRETRAEAYNDLQQSRNVGRFPERNIHLSGFSHTMIGRQRLDSLHECLDIIRGGNIPGDFVECGVWRGGACIFMAGYAKTMGMKDRKIIVADSFEGLPVPSHPKEFKKDLSKEKFPELAVSLKTVKDNFDLYGLLNDAVLFLKGWFKDTLKEASIHKIALLRLDGDYYESTMDCLEALYDKVVPGGIVIIDDYGVIKECKQAVIDFFAGRNEPMPELHIADWSGVYWMRQEQEEIRSFASPFEKKFLQSYQEGTLKYRYKGVPCLKSPIDIAIYMKVLWDLRPNSIIEIGSKFGGSALFFEDIASSYMLDAQIVSIDITPPTNLSKTAVKFVKGDVNKLADTFKENNFYHLPKPWLIVEDSAHTYEGCLAALNFFAKTMTVGDVLVMEDGILDELGLSEKYNGGPNKAITDYMKENPNQFHIDEKLCDMFGPNATYNPNGYLRKI